MMTSTIRHSIWMIYSKLLKSKCILVEKRFFVCLWIDVDNLVWNFERIFIWTIKIGDSLLFEWEKPLKMPNYKKKKKK